MHAEKASKISSIKIMSDPAKKYRGVSYDPSHRSKPWRAEIRHNYRLIYLGNFAVQEEAARAYDIAALTLKGAKAKTNTI